MGQPHTTGNQGLPEKARQPVLPGKDEHCGMVHIPQADGEGFEPPLQFPTEQFSRLSTVRRKYLERREKRKPGWRAWRVVWRFWFGIAPS